MPYKDPERKKANDHECYLRRRVLKGPRPLKPCGTESAYKRGCRCAACKRAHADHNAKYYATGLEWKSRNKTRILARKREMYAQNPAFWREKTRLWRAANPEKAKAITDRWRAANKEKMRAARLRRLWRSANAPGHASEQDIKNRVAYYGDSCAYCGGRYEHLEHVIPLSRGGTNWPANLRPSCGRCNLVKATKSLAEFIAHMLRTEWRCAL